MTDLDFSHLTQQQQGFVTDIMAGKSYGRAYQDNYNSGETAPNRLTSMGIKLSKSARIAFILAEFREKEVKRIGFTLEVHLEKLKELRDLAQKDKKWSEAIRAEEIRGHVGGHRVERVRTEAVKPVDNALQVIADILGPEQARIAARKLGVSYLDTGENGGKPTDTAALKLEKGGTPTP